MVKVKEIMVKLIYSYYLGVWAYLEVVMTERKLRTSGDLLSLFFILSLGS